MVVGCKGGGGQCGRGELMGTQLPVPSRDVRPVIANQKTHHVSLFFYLPKKRAKKTKMKRKNFAVEQRKKLLKQPVKSRHGPASPPPVLGENGNHVCFDGAGAFFLLLLLVCFELDL